MAMTNAEKQAAFKARKAEDGYKQVQIWVKTGGLTPNEAVKSLIDELENRDPTISAETALQVVQARLWALYEDFGGLASS